MPVVSALFAQMDSRKQKIVLSGLKKLPKVKDLNAEYSALLTKKKALYPEYRKTRDEMQEIVKAQKNVELFFAEEKDSKQVEQIR